MRTRMLNLMFAMAVGVMALSFGLSMAACDGVGDTVTAPGDDAKTAADKDAEAQDTGGGTTADGTGQVQPDGSITPIKLKLMSLSPNSGPAEGGTMVAVKGAGFVPGARVFFGEEEVADLQVETSFIMTCKVPPGETGKVDVSVTLPDGGSDVLEAAYTYLAEQHKELSLTAILPEAGPDSGGFLCVLNGGGFETGMSVRLGTSLAEGVTVLSPTSAHFIAPPGLPGVVNVVAKIGDNQAVMPEGFEYLPAEEKAPLALSGINPGTGPVEGGLIAIITGQGFAEGIQVQFGAETASVIDVPSANSMAVQVPPSPKGKVDVVATLGEETSIIYNGFEYLGEEDIAPLTVVGIQPDAGPVTGGFLVVLTGTGFQSDAEVSVGDNDVPFVNVLSPGVITFLAPPALEGLYDITVIVEEAEAVLPDALSYYSEEVLSLLSVEPATGPVEGGTLTVVKGGGFGPDTTVFFGGVQAQVVDVPTSGFLAALTPAVLEAGPVDVTVANGAGNDATLEGGFEYTEEAVLTVSGIQPASGTGAGGYLAMVSGSGFKPGLSISLCDAPGLNVQTLSPESAVFLVPAGNPGLCDLTVQNTNGLLAVMADAFVYTEEAVDGTSPSLGLVSPKKGSVDGGTWVLLTGKNFAAGAKVHFGLSEVAEVKGIGSEALLALTAPSAPGFANVKVTNPDGASTMLSSAFQFVLPSDTPVKLESLAPNSGPVTGGTLALVTGAEFKPGLLVHLGYVPVPFVKYISDTEFVMTTPPGKVGPADLVVVNPDGTTATLPQAFAYFEPQAGGTPPPVISGLFPKYGAAQGGFEATVIGSNFQEGAAVVFDGIPVDVLDAQGDGVLKILTKPHVAGSADVAVVNPDGQTSILPDGYTFFVNPPFISAVVPGEGPLEGGNQVTIVGSGFAAGAKVFWDGEVAGGVIVTPPDGIQLAAPPHEAGVVSVAVVNPDGLSATVQEAYTYLEPDEILPPEISSVSPAAGTSVGGFQVIVQGAEFQADAQVFFGAKASSQVQFLSPAVLVALVPSGAPGETVNVKVVVSGGLEGVLEDGFSYNELDKEPLALLSVMPPSGPAAGGTSVAFLGAGFVQGVTNVEFGGTPGANISVVSSNLMTAVTQSGMPGAVDVTVSGGGEAATLADGFLYLSDVSQQKLPQIQGLSPSAGPAVGGTMVQVVGENFKDGAEVNFGGLDASVVFKSSTLLLAQTPAHEAGTVSVVLQNPDGGSTILAGAFTFYEQPGSSPPMPVSVNPGTGSALGGDLVTVSGVNFVPGLACYVCGNPTTDVLVASANQFSARTPPGTGSCDVDVVNPDGQSGVLENGFSFLAPQPTLANVVPAEGPLAGGIEVVMYGSDFMEGMVVWFGVSQSAKVTLFSNETASALVPPGLPGKVNVKVVNPGGPQAVLQGGFEYKENPQVVPPPAITLLVPASGPSVGGTVVNIQGESFQDGAKVFFAGVPAAQISVLGEFSILATTPPKEEGLADVTVLNPDGQGTTLPDGFEYVLPTAPAPVLFGVVPPAGPQGGGTSILVTGKNLTSKGMLYLNFQPVTQFTFLNDAVISGATPSGEPGPAVVSFVGADGQEASLQAGFTYIPAPKVESISPKNGPVEGGVEITIVGQNFQPGAEVFFGDIEAEAVDVENGLIINATTPAAEPGKVDVTVLNTDGQSGTMTLAFEYLLPPEIEHVAPAFGPEPGGTPVSIWGLNFADDATVAFGDAEALEVTLVMPGLLLCKTPAGTGIVDMTVTNGDGQSATLAEAFEYLLDVGDPPNLIGINPVAGPEDGGTLVTLFGENLGGLSSLLLGNVPVETITSVADEAIIFETPAHLPGIVDVVFVGDDGQSSLLEQAFEFIAMGDLEPPPLLLSLTPQNGPTGGNTVVSVTGEEFQDGAQVYFGNKEAAATSFVSELELTVKTPAHPQDLVDVTVLNPDGQVSVLPEAFTFVPPPVIDTVEPDAGSPLGGTEVIIAGSGFRAGDTPSQRTKVFICLDFAAEEGCQQVLASSITLLTTDEIVFMTPQHLPGFVDVGVVNPDAQQDFVGSAFYYNEPPVLDSIDPVSGPTSGGTPVTVTGSGFVAGMVILFGDAPATEVIPVSGEQVVAVTPAGEAGEADVTVINPDGTPDALGQAFLYIAPPSIANMYPISGPENGGTDVTLEGSAFWSGDEPSVVFFGDVEVPAEDTQVFSNNLIIATTPPGAGPVPVKVLNPDGQQVFAAQSYVYVPPSPPPTINYIVPSFGSGAGGEWVAIMGTGFLSGAQVFFGTPDAWVAGTNATVQNLGTMITVRTPQHEVGTVSVRILNSNQQEAIAENAFEFTQPQQLPALDFTAALPNRIPVDGGVQVTISGKGFKPGIQVFFGTDPNWVAGTQTQYLGPTILHTVAPESPTGDAGEMDILLMNPPVGDELDNYIAEDAIAYTSGGVFQIKGIRIPPDGRNDGFGAVGDFNNDGLADVTVMRSGTGEVFLNTEPDEWGFAGWFQKSADLTNWNSATWYHTQGDYDGDGDIDIIERRSDRAALQRNNGDGTFSGAEDRGWLSWEARYMTSADFNCDGYLDVFVATYSTSNSRPNRILVNDGNGGFADNTSALPAQYEHTIMAAAGDVDLDGDIDLLLANDTAMQNRLYYNNCGNIPHPPTCHNTMCSMQEYNNHSYAICSPAVTWEQAQDVCEANGYYLAVMNDQAEQNWLTSVTNSDYWIGYSDQDEEGQWEWYGDSANFSYWQSGQPDNSGDEDCAVFRWWGDGRWNDWPCGNTRKYICETAIVDVCPVWQFTEAAYGPASNFPISGFNTQWISLVDLDENGYADAVVANWGQNSKVYMNYVGNFQPDDYAHYPQDEENPYIGELFPADVDLDGDTDVMARVRSDGGEWYWLRTYVNDLMDGGSGSLTLSEMTLPARSADTTDLVVGDFDGDLLPDVWVINKNHQDQLLINDGFVNNIDWEIGDETVGAGGFAYNSHFGMPEDVATSHDVVAGDINGDGAPDVVKANWKWDRLRILVNQGDGNFLDESEGRSPVIPGDTLTLFNGLKLADMNDDGHLDIVVGGYRGCDWAWTDTVNRVRVLLNDGDGYFTDETEGNVPSWTDHSVRYVDTGDLNGDGKADIFVSACSHCYCYSPKYEVLINGGDPFNTGGVYFFDVTNTWLGPKHTYPNSGTLIDLDQDGLLDLYEGRGAGGYQNRLFFNNGATLAEVTDTHLPSVADDTYATWVDDFDGDGDLDLYSVNWGQDRLYLQELNHTFSDVTTSNVPGSTTNSYDGVKGDFDGDGTPDMFIINHDQKNELFLNTGNGQLVNRSDNLPWDQDWGVGGAVADFDLDGDLDVFVTTSSVDRMYLNVSQ